MNIGMIACTYYMRIYQYKKPDPFNWGDMTRKYQQEFTREDFLQLAREIYKIGFNNLEIWEPMFSYKVYSCDEGKVMAEDLKSIGFQTMAYCIGGWGADDVDSIGDAYAFAKALGCEIVTGCIRLPGVDVVLPAIEAAGLKYNMKYAIENHPEPSVEKPEDVYRLCLPYQTIGANLDTGIYNMMGYDLLAAADLLKEKIFHVHFKDSPRGGQGCQPLGDADTPLAPLLRKLRDWNYRYMVSVEYEYPTDPEPGLYKSLGYINGVLA